MKKSDTCIPFHSLSQLSENKNVLSLWESNLRTNSNLIGQCVERNIKTPVCDRAISNIISPEILIFEPEVSNHTGILIIPGGGYQRIAIDKEGLEVARLLTKWGYTAFVMSYRMPGDHHPQGVEVSFADAQRAMRVIQSHNNWQEIIQWGVLGFSAGGHIAARLATTPNHSVVSAQDDIDRKEICLDFAALMYPVISMDPDIAHTGSRAALTGAQSTDSLCEQYSAEKHVSQNTPPCFITHATDDQSVVVENSLALFHALKQYSVPVELHLFESGGHGFAGKTKPESPAHLWPELLNRWIKQLCYTQRPEDT